MDNLHYLDKSQSTFNAIFANKWIKVVVLTPDTSSHQRMVKFVNSNGNDCLYLSSYESKVNNLLDIYSLEMFDESGAATRVYEAYLTDDGFSYLHKLGKNVFYILFNLAVSIVCLVLIIQLLVHLRNLSLKEGE